MEQKSMAVMFLCMVISFVRASHDGRDILQRNLLYHDDDSQVSPVVHDALYQMIPLELSLMSLTRSNLFRTGDKETACSPDDVVMAMTICQGERQRLSYASQTNDTAQLCKALQHYSDCMKPRVQGCQGPAKMAFDVIISRFTGEPYNCQTGMQTETSADNGNDKIIYTTASKDDHEHPSSAGDSNRNIDDDQETSTTTNLYRQASHTNMSVEISTTVLTNIVTSENMTNKETTASLNSDTCNSGMLIHLYARSTAITSCFIIWIWCQTM